MKWIYKYLILLLSLFIINIGCINNKFSHKNEINQENGVYKEDEIYKPIIEEKQKNEKISARIPFLPHIEGFYKGIVSYNFIDKYGNIYSIDENRQNIHCSLYKADIDILLQVKDFIYSLRINEENPIKDITFLETFPQLKYLEIENKNIENLETISHFKYIEQITIGRDYPQIINCTIFKDLKSLEKLWLTNNKYINIESILNLSNLEIITDNFYKGNSNSFIIPILEFGKYHVLKDKVDVRTGATEKYDIIAILNLHDEIEIIENSWIAEEINDVWGYWYKINHGNINGYIFGGNIAVKTFITDIDKNGINDYFYYRYSSRSGPTVFFYPFRDVIIYINNKKINTNIMSKNKEFFNGNCKFEEKDGYVLVRLDGYARDDEYNYWYKILPNGIIEYIDKW
jgi:hypothetical protein